MRERVNRDDRDYGMLESVENPTSMTAIAESRKDEVKDETKVLDLTNSGNVTNERSGNIVSGQELALEETESGIKVAAIS